MTESTAKTILAKQFSIRELLILLFLCALASSVVVLQRQLKIEHAKNQLLQSRIDWRTPSATYLRIDRNPNREKLHVGASIGLTGSVYTVSFGTPFRLKAELIEIATETIVSETEFDAVSYPSTAFGSEKLELPFSVTIPGKPNMQPGKYLIKVSLLSDGQQEQASGSMLIEFSL